MASSSNNLQEMKSTSRNRLNYKFNNAYMQNLTFLDDSRIFSWINSCSAWIPQYEHLLNKAGFSTQLELHNVWVNGSETVLAGRVCTTGHPAGTGNLFYNIFRHGGLLYKITFHRDKHQHGGAIRRVSVLVFLPFIDILAEGRALAQRSTTIIRSSRYYLSISWLCKRTAKYVSKCAIFRSDNATPFRDKLGARFLIFVYYNYINYVVFLFYFFIG